MPGSNFHQVSLLPAIGVAAGKTPAPGLSEENGFSMVLSASLDESPPQDAETGSDLPQVGTILPDGQTFSQLEYTAEPLQSDFITLPTDALRSQVSEATAGANAISVSVASNSGSATAAISLSQVTISNPEQAAIQAFANESGRLVPSASTGAQVSIATASQPQSGQAGVPLPAGHAPDARVPLSILPVSPHSATPPNAESNDLGSRLTSEIVAKEPALRVTGITLAKSAEPRLGAADPRIEYTQSAVSERLKQADPNLRSLGIHAGSIRQSLSLSPAVAITAPAQGRPAHPMDLSAVRVSAVERPVGDLKGWNGFRLDFANGKSVLPTNIGPGFVDTQTVVAASSESAEKTPLVLNSGAANLTSPASPGLGADKTLPAELSAPLKFFLQAGQLIAEPGTGKLLAKQLLGMTASGLDSARIHMSPANLGPLEVRIATEEEGVRVLFLTAQPGVKDAIDESIARLRQMFEDQGQKLLGVDVQHRDGDSSTEQDWQQGGQADDSHGAGQEENDVLAQQTGSSALLDLHA